MSATRKQDTFPRRRTFRVERFPPDLRTLVDRGLAQGRFYREIQQDLAHRGLRISENALRGYWRHRWRHEHRRFRWANAQADRLAELLRHTGETNEAVLARKLLLSLLLNRLEGVKDTELFDLLREVRETVKATRHLDSAAGEASRAARPRMSRAEMQRKVREIYGWPEEELDREPGPAAH